MRNLLDLSNVPEELEIVEAANPGEMDDPGDPVMLDVSKRDVPLPIHLLRSPIREVVLLLLLHHQMPMHHPTLPQYLRQRFRLRRRRRPPRLHHHPQHRRLH